MENGSEERNWIWRTTGNIDNRYAAHQILNSDRTCWVGCCCLNAAKGCTGADSNDCRGFGGNFSQDIHGCFPGNLAVNAAIFGRNSTFNNQDKRVIVNSVMEILFSLMTSGCHDCFVIIK